MAIVTLAQVKEQLAFTDDIGSVDDDLLQRKLDAAQGHIERLLGYAIEEEHTTPPAPLIEAVEQLAAHYYENREAMGDVRMLPFGVWDIVQEYRGYTF